MDAMFNLFSIPLWTSFIFNFIFFLVTFGIGAFLGNRYRPSRGEEAYPPVGSVVITSLGIAALLLSITYGITYTKYDDSQKDFVNEANAIEIAYMRAGYLNEPDRKIIRALLTEYVYLRYNMFRSGRFQEGLVKAEKIHDKLWLQTETLARNNPNSVIVGLFIESLNAAVDFHEKHVNLIFNNSIPWTVWVVLYFITTLAIVNLGYFFGVTNTHHVVICAFSIFTFSALISLIFDLNYPQEGFILADQQALIEVINNTFNDQ